MDLVKQTHMAANNIKQQTTLTMADGRRIKYTVLKPRKARADELIFSMTKGPRSNTNRRGQAYNCRATRAERSIIEGNDRAYLKTSG